MTSRTALGYWKRLLGQTTALTWLLALQALPSMAHAATARPKVLALDQGLELQGSGVSLRVVVIAPGIVRVRYSQDAQFGPDHSFAVVAGAGLAASVQVSTEGGYSELRTLGLTVRVQHEPLRLEFLDDQGRSLDRDDDELGITLRSPGARVWKRLRDDEQVYGLGEKTGRLNKRGWSLGGTHAVMWNSDTYGYDSSTDPLYVSVPFYMVLREGRAHGIFLDNTFRSSFDIGRESRHRLSFGVEGGELNYYFIAGPHPKDVVQRFSQLTGHMPLPPRWSLGFHQCRWSYVPEQRVREVATGFRSRQIPADAIWLDIDHLDGFKPFAWDRQAFPDPARLVADLRAQGFRTVPIVDAHPKKEVGYAPYDQGLAGGHFARNPDGSVFEAPVWPSNAKHNPGPSVFPDFTRAATRAWWGSLHRDYVAMGVEGIWNDMNEPAAFLPPANTVPLDVRHANDGRPTDQREIHNVYGLLHTQATYEGLLALRPDSRPFVLTRASFAGGQRYAAVWAGDNRSEWAALRQSLPTLMGMGLSGMPFVGTDIGGFQGVPSGELFARWMQAALFAPFMRAHTETGTPEQDPWSYGPEFEAINRRTLELRYQFLPQIYRVMEEASRTGLPALRPLMLEFPQDPETWSRDDQAMFGSDLLLAPALAEGQRERDVYFPAGTWFDVHTGAAIAGSGSRRIAVPLDSTPVFARAGALVFRQPTVQHTGQMSGQTLQIQVFPAEESTAEFYEDDGETRAYLQGGFQRRSFSQRVTGDRQVLRVGAAQGRWQPAGRNFEAWFMATPTATEVRLDGMRLARLDGDGWRAGLAGWFQAPGEAVRVRWAAAMTEQRVEVEYQAAVKL